MIQSSIDQAEAESREQASQDSANVIGRILPDGLLEINGMKAHKLAWARKTIMLRAMGLRDGADNDAELEQKLVADNLDTLTIAIYVLFEPDVAKLYRLSLEPTDLVGAALVFSEKFSEEQYERMIEYATTKLNEMNDAAQIGDSGPATPGSPDEGAEKNSVS